MEPLPLPEDAWDAWSPVQLSARLEATSRLWYVVGGWALDLWHGAPTRAHEDLEFTILAEDAGHFRTVLAELDFFTAHEGRLDYLPRGRSPSEPVSQLWGAQMDQGRWRVDMMIEHGTLERWVYKRDPAIHMSRSEAIRVDATGIRYLAPALVLLFKAKHRRDKDERDFRAALPKLRDDEKAMLRHLLEEAHPGHDWLMDL